MRIALVVLALTACAHGPDAGGGGGQTRVSATKLELEVSDTGVVQRAEVALPVAALPAAVTAALASKGTIREAEIIVMPTGVAFEVEVGQDEYLIDPSGKLLAQHREADDEDEDDGDDEHEEDDDD